MWHSVKRKTSSPRYIVSKNKKRMAVRVLLGVVVTEQHCLQLPPECQQRVRGQAWKATSIVHLTTLNNVAWCPLLIDAPCRQTIYTASLYFHTSICKFDANIVVQSVSKIWNSLHKKVGRAPCPQHSLRDLSFY